MQVQLVIFDNNWYKKINNFNKKAKNKYVLCILQVKSWQTVVLNAMLNLVFLKWVKMQQILILYVLYGFYEFKSSSWK